MIPKRFGNTSGIVDSSRAAAMRGTWYRTWRSVWLQHTVARLPRLVLLAGSAWVLFLLWQVGFFRVLGAVAHVGWSGMSIIVLLPAIGLALHTVGWAILLPAAQRPRPWKAFSVYVASQAGNELGGGVLGEPIKLVLAPPGGRADATAALIVDNATALASTLGFASLAFFLLGLPHLHVPWGGVIAALALVSCAVGSGPGRRFARRTLASTRGHALHLRHALSLLLRRSPGKVATSLVAHTLGKSWIVVEFAVALAFVGDVPLEMALVLGAASVLASVVGAPIPARVGVLEAAALWAAQDHEAWIPTLLAVVLLRRVRGLLWTMAGLTLASKLAGSAIGKPVDSVPPAPVDSVPDTSRSKLVLE